MERVYEKLVRDKIPGIIRKNGRECIIEIMDDEEFERELKFMKNLPYIILNF